MPIKKSSLELPNILVRANQIIDELNRTKQEARTFQSLLLRANQSGEVSGGLLENGKSHPSFKKLTDTIHILPVVFFKLIYQFTKLPY